MSVSVQTAEEWIKLEGKREFTVVRPADLGVVDQACSV